MKACIKKLHFTETHYISFVNLVHLDSKYFHRNAFRIEQIEKNTLRQKKGATHLMNRPIKVHSFIHSSYFHPVAFSKIYL